MVILVVTPCSLVSWYLLDYVYHTPILRLWSHVPVFFAGKCSDEVSLQPSWPDPVCTGGWVMLYMNVYVCVYQHDMQVMCCLQLQLVALWPIQMTWGSCMKAMWTSQHCQHFCCYKGSLLWWKQVLLQMCLVAGTSILPGWVRLCFDKPIVW